MHLAIKFVIQNELLYTVLCQVCALKKEDGAVEVTWVNPSEVSY